MMTFHFDFPAGEGTFFTGYSQTEKNKIMYQLKSLKTPDKAFLLHQLFPEEIPSFLHFTIYLSETLLKEAPKLSKRWQNPFIAIDEMKSCAMYVTEYTYGCIPKIATNFLMFGDGLFNGKNAPFMIYVLEQFTKTRRHPNPKFVQAVDLLFF